MERVTELIRIGRDHISLDNPIDDEGETSLGDLIAAETAPGPDQLVADASDRSGLFSLVDQLDPRSADVIRRRYGLHDGRQAKLADIGAVHGISAERVRQIEREALGPLGRLRLTGRPRPARPPCRITSLRHPPGPQTRSAEEPPAHRLGLTPRAIGRMLNGTSTLLAPGPAEAGTSGSFCVSGWTGLAVARRVRDVTGQATALFQCRSRRAGARTRPWTVASGVALRCGRSARPGSRCAGCARPACRRSARPRRRRTAGRRRTGTAPGLPPRPPSSRPGTPPGAASCTGSRWCRPRRRATPVRRRARRSPRGAGATRSCSTARRPSARGPGVAQRVDTASGSSSVCGCHCRSYSARAAGVITTSASRHTSSSVLLRCSSRERSQTDALRLVPAGPPARPPGPRRSTPPPTATRRTGRCRARSPACRPSRTGRPRSVHLPFVTADTLPDRRRQFSPRFSQLLTRAIWFALGQPDDRGGVERQARRRPRASSVHGAPPCSSQPSS